MKTIKKVTMITAFLTGEGKRIGATYSELTEDGELAKQNEKVNFIALDEGLLEHINAIEEFVQKRLEGE